MSAKRENELDSTSERLRAFGALAGGTPAVPANHLTLPLSRYLLRAVQAGFEFRCQLADVRFFDHVEVTSGNFMYVHAAAG